MLAVAFSAALAASAPASSPAAEALSALDSFCLGDDVRTQAVRAKAEARGWSAYHDPEMPADSPSRYFFGTKPPAGEGDPNLRIGVELADLVEDTHGVPTASLACTVKLSVAHVAEFEAGVRDRFGPALEGGAIGPLWEYWVQSGVRTQVVPGDHGLEKLASGDMRMVLNAQKLAAGQELVLLMLTKDDRYSSIHVSRIRKENP